MPVQVLVRRRSSNSNHEARRPAKSPVKFVHTEARTSESSTRPVVRRHAQPTPARMQEVEDRLLGDAIGQHRSLDAALDRVLDDSETLSAELRRSRRRPLLLRSTTNLNRVEDLLLEAVVRSHPNRECALDRLLADVHGDGDEDAEAAEERDRAEFDMAIDNDFDGLC